MSSIATNVALILQDNGYGTMGESIYISRDLPNKPDTIVLLVDSGTEAPRSPNLGYRYPVLQIITRCTKGGYQECYDRISAIDNLLHATTYDVGADHCVYMLNIFGPSDLGYDENVRPRFSINFRAMTRTL